MYNFTPQNIQAFIRSFYAGRRINITPYAYPVVFLNLTQGATVPGSLNIQANADFCLTKLSYHAILATGAQSVSSKNVALARLMIVDNGSGEQFFASAVDLETACGNDDNERGFLPYPRLIGGRSSLSLSLTGYQPTAETYTVVNLTLEGLNVRTLR